MSEADLAVAAGRIAASDRLLVALDFDGTLSPLADEPMAARMLPAARAAIDALVQAPHTTVALVSGRTLADLRVIAEHDDTSPIWLAGSHGAELWEPGRGAIEPADADEDLALRDALRDRAQRATADAPGVWIEPKRFGFAVHTRLADRAAAEAAHRAVDGLVAAAAPAWRRRTGHDLVEYAFRHEGKDTAVATLRERTGASAVVFAGDDTTDEDALASLGAADLGVHVGERPTAATLRVPDIASLAAFLGRVAQERAVARE